MSPTHVHSIPITGTIRTTDDTPTRAICIPLLPQDGAFSITGTILAVDDLTTRSSVEFHPRFGGSIVGGKVTENDTGALAMEPQDGGAAQKWAPGALKTTITGRQMEILVTGIAGKTIDWGWALELVTLSLPSSPAAPADAKSAAPAGP
jgi:hypothetical protein